MLKKAKNLICFLGLLGAVFFSAVKDACAQEMTAIDFNGDLIGKVIPDGTAVSFDNNILGHVTADSLIVDAKGKLIGGIVPQGVVIGNDNKTLGRVNNDGSVRLPSGKIIGKVLPNGLVVDDSYKILGAVLFPGLVYNDEGQTVGRLTGDGSYVSFEGQGIGFMSADGYAYRNNGTGYVLDGRLISSKIVISQTGAFIGSVVPGGRVTNSDSAEIGRIHANGYVYDADNRLIGSAVSSGYAFDDKGTYLGLVSYNGEVISGGKVVAHLRSDGKIIDSENKVIGFRLDLAATASDLDGKYLGRLLPDGKIVKTREPIGTVTAHGFVIDTDGKTIGRVVSVGPVFDHLGQIVGQGLRNAAVTALTGTPLGYMKGRYSYDNLGRLTGAVIEPALALDASDRILGLTGIGSTLISQGANYTISPFGYVLSADNQPIGRTVSLAPLYTEDGAVRGYVLPSGQLDGFAVESSVKLTQDGIVIESNNKTVARTVEPRFALSTDGAILGRLTQTNGVVDEKGKKIGVVVPEYQVLDAKTKATLGMAPYAFLGIGMNGSLIGYADINGTLFDSNKHIIGRTIDTTTIVNTKNAVIGRLMPFETVVNQECTAIGVIDPKGKVRNHRDVILGSVLTNGQALSETGTLIGYGVQGGSVLNFEGEAFASINASGRVFNYQNEDFGCVDWNGQVYDSAHALIGRRIDPAPVLGFENEIIGRLLADGTVVDQAGKAVGLAQPDDTVVNSDGEPIGFVFRYRFAFGNDNIYKGRVDESGSVVDEKNNVIGQVFFDGSVVADDKVVGYALYDLYIYNDKNEAIGYLLSDGNVAGFSGGRLGQADHGFLVDRNYILIGRGNRDYVVRNSGKVALGVLSFNGELIAPAGNTLGELQKGGEIVDPEGEVIARAYTLQYYDVNRPKKPKPADWAGNQIKIEPVTVPEAEEEEESTGFNRKAVGIALTPDGNYLGDILANNDVVDKDGNILGTKTPDGLIMDNSGSLIGLEEVKNPSASQMFVPAGTFGPGGAYGTGNKATNLGPGGGFGPGERYDPVRSAALAAAQAARRSEIAVGQLSTNIKREDFDGKQDNWDGVSYRMSSWRVDMSEMILADKPIPAVLARTIMSGSGVEAGSVPVTAIVERNVYAEDGRNIVIPAGSHVMGESSGGASAGSGSVRVNITWKRLIRPDGSAFEMASASTGDAQGKAGALGYIDEQLLKKYSLPVATSALQSAMAYVMASGTTSTSSDGDSVESSRQQAANDARQNFLSQMDSIFQDILQNKLNIEAVTYVPAGTRIIIYPKEDLWIRTFERSQKDQENAAQAKPDVLLHDKQVSGAGASSGSSGASGASTSGVVYEDDTDAQPKSTPLIADNTSKKKSASQMNIPAVTSTGATPPPPSTDVGTSSSTGTAQLF